MLLFIGYILSLPFIFILLILHLIKKALFQYRRKRLVGNRQVAAFFHPHCAGGGGGERVLWCAVREVQNNWPEMCCAVYTVDTEDDATIRAKIKDVFNIKIPRPADLIFIRLRNGAKLIEASSYPRFTLLRQSLGSMLLVLRALFQLYPHVFFDSAGHAFTFPIVWLLGKARIGCYVHYPMISTDMLNRVKSGSADYNHDVRIAKSRLATHVKVWYYRWLASCYGLAGRCAHVTMVNSSWTKGHIEQLWRNSKPMVVYPPCPTQQLTATPLKLREPIVVAVAQFRPEKNHKLMLRAFALYLKQQHTRVDTRCKLVLIGGCRAGSGDEERVQELRQLTAELNLTDRVEFIVNAPYHIVCETLTRARVNLHCMRDEHFGIGIVEGMAAGAVPLAHKSAGPLMDIVVPLDDGLQQQQQRTGLLAETVEQYASGLHELLSMPWKEFEQMQRAARQQSQSFSERVFAENFNDGFAKLLLEQKR